MAGKKIIGGLVLGVVLLSLLALLMVKAGGLAGEGGKKAAGSLAGGSVGIVEINGVILGGNSSNALFGGSITGSETVMSQLRQISKNPDIKAVVLRINSPGGTPAASQEITGELERLKKSGIKIVTSMGDVAASGAYWIASASDQIVANPGTITGSIGVIMNSQNYSGLYDKLGIGTNTIKSGAYKDMGSTERPMTEEERKIFQSMVDDTYLQFVETVAGGRNISQAAIKDLNGRVLTGRQAMQAGLVDRMGNLHDAVSVAGEISGLGKAPRTVNIESQKQWWRFLDGIGSSAGMLKPAAGGPGEYYGALLLYLPVKMLTE